MHDSVVTLKMWFAMKSIRSIVGVVLGHMDYDPFRSDQNIVLPSVETSCLNPRVAVG